MYILKNITLYEKYKDDIFHRDLNAFVSLSSDKELENYKLIHKNDLIDIIEIETPKLNYDQN